MASIIKAGKIIPHGTTVQQAEFNWEDMSVNASHYLESVQQKAAQIVATAQQQARHIAAQAAERGQQAARDAARTAAVAEVEARWQSLAPVLQEAIDDVRQLQTRWLRDWEDRAIQLAVAIAARLVRRELAHDPRISQQWMREALQLATGCSTVTLRLHPDDYATLGDWQHQLTREFSGLSPARIVADPQIARGGCRVDTEFGFIDQQLETQLTRLQEELTG